MLYTSLTKKALNIAIKAHGVTLGKDGVPYFVHPIIVTEHVEGGEYETCVALLHDVVEDTDWTFEALAEECFPAEVIDALKLLTKDPNADYMDYIAEVKKNPIARAVKIADLEHNMDLGRLDEATDWDFKRVEKYRRAREFLLS